MCLKPQVFTFYNNGAPERYYEKIYFFVNHTFSALGFPGGSNGKESACQCRRPRFYPWVGKMPWRKKWQPIPVFLPGKAQGPWQATVHGVAKSWT